jgi:hypothetical protein
VADPGSRAKADPASVRTNILAFRLRPEVDVVFYRRCPTRIACHHNRSGVPDTLHLRSWQRPIGGGSILSTFSARSRGQSAENAKRTAVSAIGLTFRASDIRVVTLADGETVHNVFKDSDFTE